jgi:subtilisin family serine protease
VQASHAALSGSVVKEACFSTTASPEADVESLCPNGYEVSLVSGAAAGCPAALYGCDHGTHIAGIIAGHNMTLNDAGFNGVAPKAGLIAIQVFTLFKDTKVCGGREQCVLSYTSDQLRALEWVYKQREAYNIASINMSLGGGYRDKYCDQRSALTEIIERLRSKGVPTVIAAGNSKFYDGISEPACISSAIAVSALNKAGNLDVSYSNVASIVDVAAPGTDIYSTTLDGKYRKMSGTSMAAPHVAAAFALLKQKFPNDTVGQLEKRLFEKSRIVADPRTETQLRTLDVSQALSEVAGGEEDPTTSTDESNYPTGYPLGGESSVIVRTDSTSTELKSAVEGSCEGGVTCDVRQIGEGTYKIDIFKGPTGVAPPDGGVVGEMGSIEDALKGLDPKIRIFEDSIFRPLQF